MLSEPKGIEYWFLAEGEYQIKDDAPDWAKKEFEEYQNVMKSSNKPDDNGLITQYQHSPDKKRLSAIFVPKIGGEIHERL